MPNREMAKRVLEHIKANPEQHDQSDWVVDEDGGTGCGTVACVAGWAYILAHGEYDGRGWWSYPFFETSWKQEGAEALGLTFTLEDEFYCCEECTPDNTVTLATHLFLKTSNEAAVQILGDLARGMSEEEGLQLIERGVYRRNYAE